MVKRTTKKVEPLWLDLACGSKKGSFKPNSMEQDPVGWTGVDIAKTDAVDVVWDLMKFPWPFEDESVDMIRCSHFVEHIPHDVGIGLDGFLAFGNELGRVMKVGATMEIWVPYYTSIRSFQDPTHMRGMCEQSFLYWNQDWLKENGLDHYGVTCDFDYSYGYMISDPYWSTAHLEKRDFAVKHYWNVVDDLYVNLKKRG